MKTVEKPIVNNKQVKPFYSSKTRWLREKGEVGRVATQYRRLLATRRFYLK